ncbi:MAG: hypothetical protein WBQ94_24885 [Terracidiphilus sp.]
MSDWIDDLSNDEQLTEARTTAHAAKVRAADKTIRAEMPEYIRSLETEIRELGRKLAEKPNLHTSLSVHDDSDPDVQDRLQLQVSSNVDGWLETAYMRIFHGIGEKYILCDPLEETPFNLRFAVGGSDWRVGVCAENGKRILMTPAEAARYIVEPMLKRVRGKG